MNIKMLIHILRKCAAMSAIAVAVILSGVSALAAGSPHEINDIADASDYAMRVNPENYQILMKTGRDYYRER